MDLNCLNRLQLLAVGFTRIDDDGNLQTILGGIRVELESRGPVNFSAVRVSLIADSNQSERRG
jgi:hypothetical protein